MPLNPVQSLALDDAAELSPEATIVAVIGSDELVLAAVERFANSTIRAFDDFTLASTPAEGFTRHPLGEELFSGVNLVIGELPKSLAELNQIASLTAQSAASDVVLVLAGREKFLSRGMNDALGKWFSRVWASRGRQKSRALRAAEPLTVKNPFVPKSGLDSDLDFKIYAHGGVFAGADLDHGTRALVKSWDDIVTRHRGDLGTIVDLGCGSGVLATLAALRLPEAQVHATDRSWAAVESARLTAAAAGVGDRVSVTQADIGGGIADDSVDLVLFNPPFHDGNAVDEDMSHRMFRAAARMLRPGGSLAVVFNSHLHHRSALSRMVGSTDQLSRTAKYTVTLSHRR